MLLKTTVVLVCLSLAQAVPTLVSEDEITSLVSRQAAIEKYRDVIPGCKDDPSFETTKSKFKKEQGVKIPKSGKDDQCTSGKGDNHCW